MMEAFRPLRTVLCVYECLRLAFLIGVFLLLQPEGEVAFPWLALITPGAMFLLMSLFWWLNMSAYRSYGPLYLAGKGLSIITTMIWLFFANNDMIKGLLFHQTVVFIVPGIVFFLVLGDIASIWLVNTIIKSTNERG
jgi:hypothetical protein